MNLVPLLKRKFRSGLIRLIELPALNHNIPSLADIGKEQTNIMSPPPQMLPGKPCHYETIFIRDDGSILPCCNTWPEDRLVIGNIKDDNLLEKLYKFDQECDICGTYRLKKADKEDKIHFRHVIVETSKFCHVNCAMCGHFSPYHTRTGRYNKEDLSYYYDRFLDICPPQILSVLGGETLVQEHGLKWFTGVKKKYKDIYVELVTSGNVKPHIADTIEGCFDSILISFYGFQPETYRKVTNLPIDQVLEFSDLLITQAREKVHLKFLTTPINFHESAIFLDWALKKEPGWVVSHDCNTPYFLNMDLDKPFTVSDAYPTHDKIPNNFWKEILHRTVQDIIKTLKKNSSILEGGRTKVAYADFLFKWGGLSQDLIDLNKLPNVTISKGTGC
jgi:MoaA/NifB/PqqE/SkfB family radical SAM enzyme